MRLSNVVDLLIEKLRQTRLNWRTENRPVIGGHDANKVALICQRMDTVLQIQV